jgi:hypothetical protein
VTAYSQVGLNTIYKTEIDSLLRDSTLLSNIVNDLYANVEIADSLNKSREIVNRLCEDNISNCDSIIYVNSELNELYANKINYIESNNSELADSIDKLKVKNTIKNIAIVLLLLISLKCFI